MFQEKWLKNNWAIVLGVSLAVLVCLTAVVIYTMRKRYIYDLVGIIA